MAMALGFTPQNAWQTVGLQMCWHQDTVDGFVSKVDGKICVTPMYLIFWNRIHWLSVSASQRFWLDPFISATSRAMPESVFEGTSLCKFFVARSDFDAELVVGFGVEVYCTPALWGSRSLEFGKIIAASTGRSKGGTFFCWFPRHAEIATRVQLASLHMASQLCAPSRTGMGWEALWKMNGVPLTFVNTLDYH